MSRAAFAAGLAAAILLPGAPLGVGVLLLAALIAAAVVRVRRLPPEQALLGLLALALASVAAVRDATWLVALDLGAAWLLASLAASGVGVGAARREALACTRPRLERDERWSSWNLSRARARGVVRSL